MNFFHSFSRAATAWPRHPALFRGQHLVASFEELAARSLKLAAGFRRAGLVPGDRVAVVMNNRPEFVEVMLATWAAGLCLVPANAKLHEREFAYVLGHSAARLCVTDAAHFETMARSAEAGDGRCELVSADDGSLDRLRAGGPARVAEVEPTEAAWVFYTSGTTGRPKGAVLTHRNLWMMTLSFMLDGGPFDLRTRSMLVAPLSHASGLLLMSYMGRGGAGVIPDSGGFDPAELIGLINHFGSAHAFAAPTMVKRFIESGNIGSLDVAKLDTIVYGGGPMYVADTLRALEVIGPRLWQIYGQGETPCTISFLSKELHAQSDHPRFLDRLASVGQVRTGVMMKVVDDDGREVSPGTIGQVAVRGDTVMRGYLDDPKATADAIRDGWLMTGDLGVLDQDGFLTLKDRSKDLIISGGTNIYPREIEEVLQTHPRVREAAVIGVPHPEWGEEAVAFVVGISEGGVGAPSPDELDRLCLANIARFKRPKRYVFVGELPKNNYGKILKTALRERILAEASQGGSVRP